MSCSIKVAIAIAPALAVTMATSIACAIYRAYGMDDGAPDITKTDLKLPYDLISFALALLLVFKTNTAYARFWEGVTPRGSCCQVHDRAVQ